MKKLQELFRGDCARYLIPLFWLHGEEEDVLRHMIGQMNENGIGEFVVESRPHPDFLGDRWWRDVDVVLDEAKKRNMKVWFFDDRKFPSGYSAGKIRDTHPEFLKIYLSERHLDAVGPQQDSYVLMEPWLEKDEQLVGVVAARRTDGLDGFDYDSLTDITDCICDGMLMWDIPQGDWRIFIFVATREGGEEHTKDYLNPLEPEPVQAFLQYVYEPFYQQYKEDFGKTIAGFFTDEPRFGNGESYDYTLGSTSGFTGYSRPKIVLPWSKTLLSQLNDCWQGDFRKVLPCLWYDTCDRAADARYTYMDLVSTLFGKHYTQQIGDWCRAHHVKYMGHVIEENGAHARLGYGAGHFFRSIRGQDYPGMDIIHQVWPGVTQGRFTTQVGYLDADFFYWGLTKMTASAAHITSRDSGTSICEIFGAYGWQAGLKLMKWLTDHICVRGINYLVPHAFSPTACDWDAPPHFYDRGLNPQWRYFHIWADYANRICHLLSGGTHVATAAVLYHAEAEWAGAYMPFEKPVKALLKRQIDCDVVPADVFTDGSVRIGAGTFEIGGESYKVMVVPYAEKLPEDLLEKLSCMADAGILVLFVKDYPAGSPLQTEKFTAIKKALQSNPMVQVCSCEDLADEILRNNLQDVILGDVEENLRIYHYSHSDGQVYFMVNESVTDGLSTTVTLKGKGVPVAYDAMEQTLYYPKYTVGGEQLTVEVSLDAWQSVFLILVESAEEIKDLPVGEAMQMGYKDRSAWITLPCDGWQVSVSKAPDVDVFESAKHITGLGNAAAPGKMPTFTGTFRYEYSFQLPEIPENMQIVLDLGRVYETAEVWINGHHLGSRIAPPYCFKASQYLQCGENKICVDVTNTLAKERGNNLLDRDMVQEPSGLIGPVAFYTQQ